MDRRAFVGLSVSVFAAMAGGGASFAKTPNGARSVCGNSPEYFSPVGSASLHVVGETIPLPAYFPPRPFIQTLKEEGFELRFLEKKWQSDNDPLIPLGPLLVGINSFQGDLEIIQNAELISSEITDLVVQPNDVFEVLDPAGLKRRVGP